MSVQSKKNIWRTWETERDVTCAERFGTLLAPIYDRRVSPHDVKKQIDIIEQEVLPFANIDDAILTVGPQIMVLTLCSMFIAHFGEARFLVWDSTRRQYIEKHVKPRGKNVRFTPVQAPSDLV